MKTKQLALAVAAIMAGTIAAGTAQAAPAASAESIVTLENFTMSLTNGSGTHQLNAGAGGNISLSAVSSTETASANLTGFAPVTHNSSSSTGATMATNAFLGTMAAPVSGEITGNTTATPTNFTSVFPLPFSPNSNFAASGMNEVGSPALGLPDAGAATSATLHNASYASVLDNSTAGTNTNSGLTARWTFTGAAGVLNFNFNVGAYLGAYLSLNDALTAKSAFSVTFALTEAKTGLGVLNAATNSNINGLTNVYNFNNNIANNAPGTGTTLQFVTPGNFNNNGTLITIPQSFSSIALDATKSYQLVATLTTDANVELKVPEPGILGLLGIGLLGLGVSSRKFSHSSVTFA